MKRKMLFCQNYGTNFLLDTYPANLAFSMFKLSSSYSGNCLRVVRSSDNATLDIGFVGDVLDTATLLSFIGSNNGYVNRWFNQSSSNNAVQDVLSSMPRIVNAGVLETLNGHPTLYFDGTNDSLVFLNETVTIDFSVFSYGKRTSSGSLFAPMSGNGSALLHFTDDNYYFQVPTGYLASNSTDSTTTAYLLDAHSSTATKELYKNQVSVPGTFNAVVLSDNFTQIGSYSSSSFMGGKLSEVIMYKTNQSANRIAIGNDIISRNS